MQVGFFGMGIEDPRGEEAARDTASWSDGELDDYYRREARRGRWAWVRYALIVLAVAAILAFQILRGD